MNDRENLNGKKSNAALINVAHEKPKKRCVYVQPKILSADRLEAAAATCDGSGGYGKSAPGCNPETLGS